MSETQPPVDSAPVADADSRRQAIENLPPPRFETLVQLLASQAVVAMGMVPGPDGSVTKELPLARHFIDLLGVIEDRTKGNLSPEEAKSLDFALHELRMTFIYVSKT